MSTPTERTADEGRIDGKRRKPPRTFLGSRTLDGQVDSEPSEPSGPAEELDSEIGPGGAAFDTQPGDLAGAGDTTPTYAYEAVVCQVFLGAGDDPFTATLLLTGDDEDGDEVSVWMRLTPTLITRLTQQLTQVFHAQQEAMGIITSDPATTDDNEDDKDEDQDDEDQDDEDKDGRERLLRRASDPLGVRYLRERPAALKWLAIGIGSLLIISIILRMTVLG